MDSQKWPWQCQRVYRYPRYRKIFPTMELTFECVIGNDYEVSSKSQWRNRIRIKYCRDTGCIIPCSYKKYYKTKVGTLKSTRKYWEKKSKTLEKKCLYLLTSTLPCMKLLSPPMQSSYLQHNASVSTLQHAAPSPYQWRFVFLSLH